MNEHSPVSSRRPPHQGHHHWRNTPAGSGVIPPECLIRHWLRHQAGRYRNLLLNIDAARQIGLDPVSVRR